MIRPGLLYFAQRLMAILPPTRCYRMKVRLLRWAGVQIASDARVVSTVRFGGSSVVIGGDSYIGHETMIMGAACSTITIGNCVDISSRVCIISGTHQIDMVGRHSAGEGSGKDITIGNGVWIGFGCNILPGVTIGEKAVIGAGSVITADIPPYCIAVGNPCRPIRFYDTVTEQWVDVRQQRQAANIPPAD